MENPTGPGDGKMPALSFSGETSVGPFWEQILSGRKQRTMREPRVRPIKVDDWLVLYWKMRIPANRKPIHKIGETVCIETTRVKLLEILPYPELCMADGFGSRDEFWDWFLGEGWADADLNELIDYALNTEFDIIKWRYPLDD